MRRIRCMLALLVATAALVAGAAPARAGGGHDHRGWGGGGHYHRGWGGGGPRVVVGVGPTFWWGSARPYGWYGWPPYYFAPPPIVFQSAPPPVVIESAPPVYVERPAPEPAAYWYYCPSAGAYYPDAPTCPERWVRVLPDED